MLPGFVESHGHVGIDEEGNGPIGNDVNEMTRPTTPGVRAIDAVNIDDEGFRDALSGGITSVVVKPGSGNVIGGQTVAIKTWGGRTIDEQVISESVSVKSALGENPKRVYGEKKQMPSTRLGVAFVLREAFAKAQHYAASRVAAEKKGEPFARDLDLEVLARVLDGEARLGPARAPPRRHRDGDPPRRRVRLPPGHQPRDRGAQARRRPGRARHPGDLRADAHQPQQGRGSATARSPTSSPSPRPVSASRSRPTTR